jgi:hypothetical protein
MSEDLLDKLLEYIDARIDEKSESTRESSDGGIVESIRTMQIKDELRSLASKELRLASE